MVDVSPEMVEKLVRYKALLLRWSEKVNLIGPEARENLDDHIAEAVEAATVLKPSGNVLDFGSGGGLPGIPMAIWTPQARFHFLEADSKKWAFLKRAVRECGLDAEVHGERLETFVKRESHTRFNVVTSRAVGHPETWIPLLTPLLASDARIALFERGDSRPAVANYAITDVLDLPRGQSNHLVVLQAVPRGTFA